MKLENKFKIIFEQFSSELDPAVHREAVATLLREIDLDDLYQDLLDEPNAILNFFSSWKKAAEEEDDPKEAAALRQMSIDSLKLLNQKNYRELSEMFFDITFKHLAEFLNLESREDFEKLTDHDLYKKSLIPNEIFLQMFLLETLFKSKDFRWDRDNKIIKQNLTCLIVCFGDIYSFLEANDSD